MVRRVGVLLIALLGLWLVLTLVAYGLFSAEESEPGSGRGERIVNSQP